MPGQRLQKPPAGPRLGLYIRVVADPGAGQRGLVIAHTVDHKTMEPIACPRVIATQRLEHENRLTELVRPLGRPIQREVPPRASAGDHPIEDVLAVSPNAVAIPLRDSNAGYQVPFLYRPVDQDWLGLFGAGTVVASPPSAAFLFARNWE